MEGRDEIRFQYYKGDITKSSPLGFVTLEQFTNAHANPSDKLLGVFDRIEEAVKDGDLKLKAKLKMENLHSFTVSAIFNNRRKYTNILEFNPIAQLDFDGLTEEKAEEYRDYLFENYPFIICTYLSPSRRGVKALVRIPKIDIANGIDEGIKEYKAYYRALETEFSNFDGFDPAPKNMALPLFISYDFFMRTRRFFEAEVWTFREEEEEDLKDKYKLPPKPYRKLKSNDRNEQRAINTVRKSISLISSSPGHYQLRSACLIFGSRVGSGYVSMYQAKQEIENLVRANHYLSKGVSGYLTTALWALEEGYKSPKAY